MKNKFQTLQPWLDEILTAIKKDIKTDYLPADAPFYRTHFGNRPQNRLSAEEINRAFTQELIAGNEEMAEWVINRWVFKHGDVYSHFEERLSKINDDFDAIKELTAAQSEQVLAGAVESFGAKAVYFFSMLNGVVFPQAVFNRLESAAKAEHTDQKASQEKEAGEADLANMIERHQREMTRLNEKYEQKLAGVLKKYAADVASLKSQIRALQSRRV